MSQNIKLKKKQCEDGVQMAMMDWNRMHEEGYFEDI